jgi:3-oxoacyl-[acyl-carrier-protein] synthase-3
MNAPRVYVDHFSYALGERKCSVEESVEAGRTLSRASELDAAGFRYHHIAGDDTTGYDLARAAVASGDPVDQVDAIVYATCLPESANVAGPDRFAASRDVKHLMDYPASRLQAELGLDRAFVVGINQQACTSALGALRLARALLIAEPCLTRALCVTSDRFPAGARYEQAYNLISDGAAACIMSREAAGYQLLASHHITNGGLVHADDDETVGVYFTYMYRLVTETLARAQLDRRDLQWVIPQNTHVKAWEILAQLLQLEFDRVFFESMSDVAHVISGDNIVNLKLLDELGLVKPGDKVLLVMAGYGMNWQATLLEKV